MIFFNDSSVFEMSENIWGINCLFDSTNSPKPKDIHLTVVYDKQEHQILTFETTNLLLK